MHEHPIAHAARILRLSGATSAQVEVGVKLAVGKSKPQIADELLKKEASIVDLTKKLYATLGVHNSAELCAKIWLSAMHERSSRTTAMADEICAAAAVGRASRNPWVDASAALALAESAPV